MSLVKKIRIRNPVSGQEFLTDNNVFLAPLAGIGDRSFRILTKRFGAGLTFTEMTSAHGLANRNQKTLDLIKISKGERPTGIQIFGSNPEIMNNAASVCNEYPADLIDINGGCSVKKVVKTGAGASILGYPEMFYKIVKVCVDASIYPVSVKIRLGLNEDRINVLENAQAAQDAGASLLTLHPRTARVQFGGKAAWEYIGLVKQELKIPVCGNGDIKTPADAVKMMLETGCDAVMIGRAAIGNPWIVKNTIRAFDAYPDEADALIPTKEERVRCAREHMDMIVTYKGEIRGIREVKRHLHRYLKGIPRVSIVRHNLFELATKAEVEQELASLLG
jgi:tRNA-dihydrouridine synthase B